MANSLTSYTGDGTKLFSGQIKKLEFNTDTAGTSDPVILTGDTISNVTFTYEDVAAENASAATGFPHASNVHLEFDLQTLGEAGGTTFMDEITNGTSTSIKIAWLRITFLAAQTFTIDSGTNDDPIMFFHSQLIVGDKEQPAKWRIIGDATVAKQDVTIS
jgi:hypothetical protein